MFSVKFNHLVNIPHVRFIDGLLSSSIASFANFLFSDHDIMMRNILSQELLRRTILMGQKAPSPFSMHTQILANFNLFRYIIFGHLVSNTFQNCVLFKAHSNLCCILRIEV